MAAWLVLASSASCACVSPARLRAIRTKFREYFSFAMDPIIPVPILDSERTLQMACTI